MNRARVFKIGMWIALVLVLAVLATIVDWRETADVIRQGNPLFIGLAVLLSLLRFVVWSWKWQKTISPLSQISVKRLLPILLAGVFLNQITPGRDTGGEPVRAYYVSRATGLKKRQALATVMVDKTANYTAISTYIGFGILFITLFLSVPRYVKIVLEALLLVFVLGALSAVYVKKSLKPPFVPMDLLSRIYFFTPLQFIRRRFRTYSSFEDYVMERIREFLSTFKDLMKEKENVRDNVLLSYLIWFMVFLQTYLVFLAFKVNPSIFLIIAVESISILLGVISFLPGGAGASEVTMIALFRSAGISIEIATAVTVVTRAIFYILSLGLGYAALLYLKITEKGDYNE